MAKEKATVDSGQSFYTSTFGTMLNNYRPFACYYQQLSTNRWQSENIAAYKAVTKKYTAYF